MGSRTEVVPISGSDDFEAWIRPHLLSMRRFAVSLVGAADAEDLLQDSLTQAWRKRRTFEAERGTPQAWLLAVVRSVARKRRRLEPIGGPPITISHDSSSDVDLERAIEQLADRQQLAVKLHYLLDLPINEVAFVMECAPGTVKATLSQARARLREHLGDSDDD